MSGWGGVLSLRDRRLGRTALQAAVGLALALAGLGPAPALSKPAKPPKSWSGSYSGVNFHPPEVGLVTRWSGDVRFKKLDFDRERQIYNYIGTGTVTYTYSEGNGCTYSGTQTFTTSGGDAALTVLRKHKAWKYFLEIGLDVESLTVQVDCPEQPTDQLDLFPPEPLQTGRRARAVNSLSSISGDYNDSGTYLTNWSLSG